MPDPRPEALSSELLGFAPEARVLVVNADDLGMYAAVNVAILDAIEHGIASSCSLMAPCPAAGEVMRMLRRRPWIPFGVHLTVVCDTPRSPWGPLSDRSAVPSLLDGSGRLFAPSEVPELLAQARPEELEVEFRAQIEAVVGAGLSPTHLDWHCLADGGRDDILELTVSLAAEYGLAVRVWLDSGRRAMRRRRLPVVDHPFLDSFSLDLDHKGDRFAQALRDLPAGLNEWAVHPGLDDEEARTIDDGWRVRTGDHRFLTSPEALDIVRQEGIVVIDYRVIRDAWHARASSG